MKKMAVISFLPAWLLLSATQQEIPYPATPQRQPSMIVIKGPVSFMMGSPKVEEFRSEDELQHVVTIPRSFEIGVTEVTVEQFQQFLNENPAIRNAACQDSSKCPSIKNKKLLRFSPEPNCPQIYVTWYEAAQYCNWLSKKAGIPQQEWSYPANETIKNGMILPPGYLNRKGYRLPTEAEWEYAARGGTSSSRYYTTEDDSLFKYAWYSKNPPQAKGDPMDPNDPSHTYPVGMLKPNRYGLYDMYGNVWEWCDSDRLPYPTNPTRDEVNINRVITDTTALVRRGGSFSYGKDVMRSAHRGAKNYYPNQRRDNVGFRIARTIN